MHRHKKKISHSFAASYYNYLLMRNKIKTQTRKVEMDFRTYGNTNSGAVMYLAAEQPIVIDEKNEDETQMMGGYFNNEEMNGGEMSDGSTEPVGMEVDDATDATDATEEKKEDKTDDDDEDDDTIDDDDFQDQVESNFNLEELTNLYSVTDVENSKMINETSKLISDAVNDKKWTLAENSLVKNYDD